MLGQNIITDIIQERGEAKINLANFVSGVYNVTITTDKGVVTKRLIIE